MRQHPDPDDHHEDHDRYHDDGDEDEEDPEELGTPVYQGTGLSVRALTAEELQSFLDAHHDNPPSCWAAAGPPSTHRSTPWGVPGLHQPRRCPCRPGRSPAAWAAPAARP